MLFGYLFKCCCFLKYYFNQVKKWFQWLEDSRSVWMALVLWQLWMTVPHQALTRAPVLTRSQRTAGAQEALFPLQGVPSSGLGWQRETRGSQRSARKESRPDAQTCVPRATENTAVGATGHQTLQTRRLDIGNHIHSAFNKNLARRRDGRGQHKTNWALNSLKGDGYLHPVKVSRIIF